MRLVTYEDIVNALDAGTPKHIVVKHLPFGLDPAQMKHLWKRYDEWLDHLDELGEKHPTSDHFDDELFKI